MEADLTQRSFQGVKYDAIVSDGKYFYVLANDYRCTGPQPDPSNIRFTSCILVYSRQGTPLRKYALDHPASDILGLSGCHLRLQPVERLRAGVRLPPG